MTDPKTTIRYCVDGLEFNDPDAPYAGDGQFPPFVIFDIAEQENLPGHYQTRQEAEEALDKLKRDKLQEALAIALTPAERQLLLKALKAHKSIPSGMIREVDRYEAEGWPGATLARKDGLLEDREENRETVAALATLIEKLS